MRVPEDGWCAAGMSDVDPCELEDIDRLAEQDIEQAEAAASDEPPGGGEWLEDASHEPGPRRALGGDGDVEGVEGVEWGGEDPMEDRGGGGGARGHDGSAAGDAGAGRKRGRAGVGQQSAGSLAPPGAKRRLLTGVRMDPSPRERMVRQLGGEHEQEVRQRNGSGDG